jgi:tetratricopeptide (TPR) repeat protein
MRYAIAFLLPGLVVAALSARQSTAGDMPPALATGYGNGVHAYNDGDYQCSYDELSRVIEAGSNDPRVFYFRGLAAHKLGRTDEADADFQQGANLEADGVGGRAVSRALERIQGCDRLKLEQYRSQARVSAVQRDREAIRQRYSDIYEAEPDVLRRRRPEPVEQVPAPAAKKAEQAAEAEEPAEEAAEESAEEPAAEPGDTSDPFGDAPAAGT